LGDIHLGIRRRQQLVDLGYPVIEAASGEQALAMIEQIPDIAIVVSDIIMPELDGLALCRKIKTDALTSHIPVLLLTAKGNTSTQIDGLEPPNKSSRPATGRLFGML
ncbi:MAG TPA: response regulator, partial [Acidobacteriota bacterium]|nr:response regulator [Acidobacteriota bacterium]